MIQLGRLHPSALEDWQGCGKRFEYATVLRERPTWRHPSSLNGTAIHKAIATIHSEKLWDAPRAPALAQLYGQAFHDAIEHPLYESERDVPIWWGDLRDEAGARADFAADALDMLDGFRLDPRNRDAAVVMQEALWRATFGGFDWEGTLDRADDMFDGTVAVRDFKSSAQALDEIPLLMWPQGLTYAMGMQHGVFRPIESDSHEPWSPRSLKVSQVTWVQLREYIPYQRNGTRKDGTTYKKGERGRGPVFYSVNVTPAMLDSHAREIELFAQAVESGRFERRPSNQQCMYRCKHTARCTAAFLGTVKGIDPKLAIMNGGD